MVNIKTFYPYTNEDIDAVSSKLTSNDFDGVVLPVVVEEGRGDSFRILKQKEFTEGGFISSNGYLYEFLKKVELNNKKVLLSVVDLFNALSGKGESKEELHNFEVLKTALEEIQVFDADIIINNDLYGDDIACKSFFPKLKEEFPKIDMVYTMYNKWDDLSNFNDIVVKNVNYDDIIRYMNWGKQIYLPEFKNMIKAFSISELLKYYSLEEDKSKNIDITVISKESANKKMEKILRNK